MTWGIRSAVGSLGPLGRRMFLSGIVKNNHIYYSFMQLPHLYQSINIYAAVSLNRLPENIYKGHVDSEVPSLV